MDVGEPRRRGRPRIRAALLALALGASLLAGCGDPGAAGLAGAAGSGTAGSGTAPAVSSPTPGGPGAPAGQPALPGRSPSSDPPSAAASTDHAARAATRSAPAACLRAAKALPLRAQLAQLLVVGTPNPAGPTTTTLVRGSAPIGGIFLTERDLTQLTPAVRARLRAAKQPVLVAVDDEGGRVQVKGAGPALPSARRMAATLTPAQIKALATKRGRALAARGVTLVLAPDADVSSQPARAVIGDRSFGAAPATVTRSATAYAAGLRSARLQATIKHFPGHGRAVGDSHRGPARTPPVASLRAKDWLPFRQIPARTPVLVMMGHLTVPGLSSPGLPSSLDPKVYRALRQELGFTGVVITDELSAMAAVSARFGLPEATRRAIAAGADLVLFNATTATPKVLAALERAVASGTLARARVVDAAARALSLKGCGK